MAGEINLAVIQNELLHVRADIGMLRDDVEKVVDDHEARLRSVEKASGWHWIAEVFVGILTI